MDPINSSNHVAKDQQSEKPEHDGHESFMETKELEEAPQASGESIVVSPISTLNQNSLTNHNINANDLPLSSVNDKHKYQNNVLPPSVASVLSYAGAHATQINLSPEDVEYNKGLIDYSQADISSIPSISSSLLKYIQTSVSATLQSHVDISQISSLFVSASSVSENENRHVGETLLTRKDEAPQTKYSETATSELNPSDNFEVIDGTTIYMKPISSKIKNTENMIDSSIIPSSSLLSSNTLRTENMLSTTLMSTASVVSHEQNLPELQGSNLPSSEPLEQSQKAEAPVSTQELNIDNKISSTVNIQPSITEHPNQLENITPELSQNSEKAVNTEMNVPSSSDKNTEAENNPNIITAASDKHVSTSKTVDLKMDSVLNGNNDKVDIDQTEEYRLASNELPVVPSTDIPTIDTKISDEVESSHISNNNVAKTDSDNISHEKESDTSSSASDTFSDNPDIELTDDALNDESSQEESEDSEDHDDEEEFESEEVKEERKKIIQQSIQAESEASEKEFDNHIPAVQIPETNEISSVTSEKSITSMDTDNSNPDEKGKESNDMKEDDVVLENTSNNSVDNGIESKQNNQHYLGARDENSIEEIADSIVKQPPMNENIEPIQVFQNEENNNKRPGDDIKFYEPGDMIPDDEETIKSDNVDFQNKEELPDNNFSEEPGTVHLTGINNGKMISA